MRNSEEKILAKIRPEENSSKFVTIQKPLRFDEFSQLTRKKMRKCENSEIEKFIDFSGKKNNFLFFDANFLGFVKNMIQG